MTVKIARLSQELEMEQLMNDVRESFWSTLTTLLSFRQIDQPVLNFN